ncbi:unnamed protein product [Moneuplotes crassus]|uniref:Uncharacterized protein n=1 Tax=Euplotes crassus TaxID=5936 RepID=A0AAD1XHU7_EUPCR|nr:unnamed protein product [Moneuplotes crassus]
MSYATDHQAWKQRVLMEDRANKSLKKIRINPTNSFYKESIKKYYVTTNERLHESLQRVFGEKFFKNRHRIPNTNMPGNRSSSFKLMPPSNPKPPTFFEQAYLGKTRLKKLISERSASVARVNPYSYQIQEDAISRHSNEGKIRSVSRRSSRLDPNKDLDQQSDTQKSVYEEPPDQLIRGQKSYLNKRAIGKVFRGRSQAKISSLRSQTSTKQKRLARLRQKYAHMLKLDRDFVKNTLDLDDDDRVSVKKEDQETEVKSEPDVSPNKELAEKKEEEDEQEEDGQEDNPYEDQNYKTFIAEEPVDEQKPDNVSEVSKRNKLDKILSELHEERKKRKELESVVQELLSRSGISKDQLRLDS